MTSNKTRRLFVALPIPDKIKSALSGLDSAFPDHIFNKNLHITLYFIGQMTDAGKYEQALEKIKANSFNLTLAAPGTFGNRVLWIGIEPCEKLVLLQAQISSGMAELGEKIENRPYRPHITLCRLKKPFSEQEKKKLQKIQFTESWLVDEFCLYESFLCPGQALHRILQKYRLGN